MFDFLDKFLGKASQRPARTLALYGPHDDTLDLQVGLDWVLMWVKKLGLPEAEWVVWNYGGPNNRNYKEYKLNTWLKRGRVLPSDTCTSFDTGRFVSGSEGDLTDHIWYASMSAENRSLIFVADLNATSLTDDVLCEMALNVQALSCFSYGYAFLMPMEKSPPTYERGLLFGPSSKRGPQTQENEISKWGSARRGCGDYLDDEISHYLRDIYPLNFLNPHHLTMQIKGQSLKDWIEAAPKRGTLKPLIEGKLWAWTVPENRIQAIRKVLGPERLLISWGDFNTPSGGPLGHTYGAKKGEGLPPFEGKLLTQDDEHWIAEGLEKMKPLFTRYTGESAAHFDKLIASREPLFDKLLDIAFTAWSEDSRPGRPAPDEALHAFAAALGEHLVKRHRMAWYAVEDEYGRSLGVCHRGKDGTQTWSYPVDAVAKRIDRGETGFIFGIVKAVGNEIERN